MAEVVYENASRIYPGNPPVRAVNQLNLEIADGEFLVLVGPSGSGKSTALRMLAGLEDVDEGAIRIGGRDVTNVPPKGRDIAMVFQSYALYPHMTVAENMGFALKLRGVPKAQIREKVLEAARMLDLEKYLDRKPKALSGGQRQRVAMGRAIVREPSVFLMDEPLSNLDAKLRVETRANIAALQQRLGTTTIYVTHDQGEALAISDRIAVLNGGKLEQVGTPAEIYGQPASSFVARFIGQVNVLEGRVVTIADGECLLDVGFAHFWVPLERQDPNGAPGSKARRPVTVGQRLQGCIHPENLELAQAEDRNVFEAEVDLVQFNGVTTITRFRAGEAFLQAIFFSRSPAAALRRGMTARLSVDAQRILLLEAEE